MRQKKGFVLHKVCDQNILVAEGKENIDFNDIIRMNTTATFLWEHLVEKDFTIDDMVRLVCGEYDIEETTARTDCEELAQAWLEAGIITEE